MHGSLAVAVLASFHDTDLMVLSSEAHTSLPGLSVVIWKCQVVGCTDWMSGKGITGTVTSHRDVSHSETVPERFLFKVSEAWVRGVVKVTVAEDFQEGLVVNCKDQLVTPNDGMLGLIQGVYNS